MPAVFAVKRPDLVNSSRFRRTKLFPPAVGRFIVAAHPRARGDQGDGDMANEKPVSLAALGRIAGVGARKLEAYGDAFLQVIRESEG